jgi:uncharacterized protein (DUF362 family)
VKRDQRLSRRTFLTTSAAFGAGLALGGTHIGCRRQALSGRAAEPAVDLAVITGDSPAQNCRAAVEALGGLPRFVRPGDRVVIKPNPVGTNPPEDAINTHPELVGALVADCLAVGAAEVLAISHDGMRSFIANGLHQAITENGGSVKAIESVSDYREVIVPRGKILRREMIATDLLDADVFINLPIAKHHAGSEVTLAMKNLMGVNWDRIFYHRTDLHQCIAELAATVPADLTIMDANYVLLTNGPVGPGEVRHGRQVVAGVDPVAVDAFTTRAYWRDPGEIGHIRTAYELGVGEIDLSKLTISEFAA